ncbi:LLM class flavin-dependent oxidoreductase [Actinophytocola sp.]|uniref:LLM class flavin-dependent oxidoreductase n=1 Tax=Actinophytocola sp. TaxID=1872138 RepID=UPI002ED69AB9
MGPGVFRWGVLVPHGVNQEFAGWEPAAAWQRMVEVGRLAESLGYDQLWVQDCVDTQPRRSPELVFDSWIAATALAGATTRARIGAAVPCAPYHHPGTLAKRAATLDVASGGRAVLELGTGSHPCGYESYGWQVPSPSERLAILGEQIEVLDQLWREPSVTHTGEHWRLRDAHCAPTPLRSALPVRLPAARLEGDVELAARWADQVVWQGSPAEVTAARARLREACAQVGRDPSDITEAVRIECRIFADNVERDRWLGSPFVIAFWSAHPDNYCERNLVGTVGSVVRQVQRYVDAGITEMVVSFRDYPETTSLEAFRTEVVPLVTPAVETTPA